MGSKGDKVTKALERVDLRSGQHAITTDQSILSNSKELGDWPTGQRALIELLANGRRLGPGQPKLTFAQIATRLGVTRKTIHAWKSRADLQDAVYKRTLQLIEGRLPNVLHAMADAAEQDRNVPAATLCLEVTGRAPTKVHDYLAPFEALYIRLGATPTAIPVEAEEQ